MMLRKHVKGWIQLLISPVIAVIVLLLILLGWQQAALGGQVRSSAPAAVLQPAVSHVLSPTWRTQTLYDLQISQDIQQGVPAPGETLDFYVLYEHLGNSTMSDVRITSTLPSEFNFLSAQSSPTFTVQLTGSTVVWYAPYLDAGATGNLSMQVQVDAMAPVGEVVNSRIEIGGTETDSNPQNNSAVLGTTILSGTRDLRLSGGLNGVAGTPGSEMTYRLDYVNQGNLSVQDVVLTATLDGRLRYIDDENFAGFSSRIQGQTLVFTRATVPAFSDGTLFITVALSQSLSFSDTLTSTFTIAGADPDILPTNNQLVLTTAVVAPMRDVAVSATLVDGVVLPDRVLQYRVHITNTGNLMAGDLGLTATFSSKTNLLSVPDVPSYTIRVSFAERFIQWQRTQLGPGQSDVLDFFVQVAETLTDTDEIQVVAELRISESDDNPADNVFTLTTPADSATTDLVVTQRLTQTLAGPGGTQVYELHFRNEGNLPATNFRLTNTLPLSLSYVSWQGYAFNPVYIDLDSNFTVEVQQDDGTGRTVLVWDFGLLELGSEGVILLTAAISDTVPGGTSLTNTLQAASAVTDRQPQNNRADLVSTLPDPSYDLFVSNVLLSNPGPPNRSIEYGIVFRNQGNVPATQVLISNTLPAKTRFVSWDGYALAPNYVALSQRAIFTRDGQTLMWQLDRLAAGTSGEIFLTVDVSQQAMAGEILTSTVTISTTDPEVVLANNRATQVTGVLSATRDVRLDQFVDGIVGTPGGEMVYGVRYENRGNIPATGLVLTMTLPPELRYVEDFNDDGLTAIVLPDNRLVWQRDRLDEGDGANLYVRVRLTDSLNIGDVLTTIGEIYINEDDFYPIDNQSFFESTVLSKTWDLYVRKFVDGFVGTPGGKMDYGIFYWNRGNWVASNVLITETLPAGLTYFSDRDWSGFTPVSISNQEVLLQRNSLRVGEYGTIYLRTQVGESLQVGQTVTNVVEISSDNPDANVNDNGFAAPVQLSNPRWDLVVDQSRVSGQLAAGAILVYQIAFENLGNLPASSLVITDALSPLVTFVSTSDTDNFTQQGQTLVWQRDSLDAGEQDQIQVTVQVNNAVLRGSPIVNAVAIASTDQESNYNNNSLVISDIVVRGIGVGYLPILLK